MGFMKFQGEPNSASRQRASVARSALCSMCLATGLATTLRLPREAHVHGGAPFLLAYTLMALMLALPLVFLEMCLGRLTEQGAIRLWRAVPLFKGLGYVKLFASFLVAVYYMIYLGIICALLIWTAKGPVPLAECRELYRALDGYRVLGIPGYKCLSETFLKPVIDDPMWYGIVAAIIFTLWLLVSLCLIRIPQSYFGSMYAFGGAILIASVSIILMNDFKIQKMFQDIRWELLLSFDLWSAASTQLLFSTHLGFGYHVTMGGTIYQKSSIFRNALWLIMWNVFYSWFSMLIWYMVYDPHLVKDASVLMTIILIYDSSISREVNTVRSSIAYSLLLFSGLISVMSLIYPIVWCISIEDCYSKRSVGWLVTITGIFCSLSIFILGLDVITILDMVIIPIYLMTFLMLLLCGVLFVYGLESIKKDLDFILDYKLNRFVIFIWSLIPFYLLLSIVCDLHRQFGNWPHKYWTFWLTIALFAFAIGCIILWAVWVIAHKEGYGFTQKFLASLKPSRKWGPVEFKLRYKWLQHKSTKDTKFKTLLKNGSDVTNAKEANNQNNSTDSIQKILWVSEHHHHHHQLDPNLTYVVRQHNGCKPPCSHACWQQDIN